MTEWREQQQVKMAIDGRTIAETSDATSIQMSFQSDLRKSQIRRMVGLSGRFSNFPSLPD
jgi:hypothetical protein